MNAYLEYFALWFFPEQQTVGNVWFGTPFPKKPVWEMHKPIMWYP